MQYFTRYGRGKNDIFSRLSKQSKSIISETGRNPKEL